jgi:integrase
MKRFKVKPYKWSRRTPYVVDGSINGKRQRRFFETKQDAELWCNLKNIELRNQGFEGAMYDTSLRLMAEQGAEQLKPYNKTIRDAVEHYRRYLEAAQRSCKAAQCIDQLIKAKRADGKSERYIRDLASRLTRFALDFPNQMLSTITTAQIDDFLRSLDLSLQSRVNYRRVVYTLFDFAIHRGYAVDNPVKHAAKVRVVGTAPGILTVQQTARLLEAASPDILPYVSIGAFAGLRRAELERLDWSKIDFESELIEVTAENSKTAMRRHVTIQPNLREWLMPLRKHRGKVMPDDFRKAFGVARTDAGITKWPENALRHSFASYHLAHFKNAAATALELGHHDSRVTFRHYRELVKPKEAERYWNIRPATSEKVVQLATSNI